MTFYPSQLNFVSESSYRIVFLLYFIRDRRAESQNFRSGDTAADSGCDRRSRRTFLRGRRLRRYGSMPAVVVQDRNCGGETESSGDSAGDRRRGAPQGSRTARIPCLTSARADGRRSRPPGSRDRSATRHLQFILAVPQVQLPPTVSGFGRRRPRRDRELPPPPRREWPPGVKFRGSRSGAPKGAYGPVGIRCRSTIPSPRTAQPSRRRQSSARLPSSARGWPGGPRNRPSRSCRARWKRPRRPSR